VSDLLEAAAKRLGIPAALVQRSAAARATEAGDDVETVLSAWAGGQAAPAAEKAEEPEAEEAPAPEEPASEEVPEETVEEVKPEPAPQVIPKPATVEVPTRVPELVVEPEIELEPVALRDRVRAAVRVGAWTGAGLGLVGFLLAGAYWAPNAVILEDTGTVVVVGAVGVMIGVALVSILFGGIVASLSRSAVSRVEPAMELSMSQTTTGWIGGGLGLILGLIAGAMLTGFGTPVEGSEGLIQLPVLTTLVIMLLGGAVLGGLTAAIPQLLGTPVAIDEEELEEVRTVRQRLGNAVGIPLVGVVLLGLLVLPFAYILIQSNHFLPRTGAALVGILAAGGILGFAALAGNRPQMRISLGDVMVAVAGVGAVLLVILAVLFYAGTDEVHEDEGDSEAVPIVRLV
jgi:hypothetical protein